jgi:phosphatidylglycerol:prolipoprotein diacylglycerol transferase
MSYPNAIIGWDASTVLTLDENYNLVSGYFPGVRVHPAPIYETVLYLGVFAVLWKLRARAWTPGRLFALYMVLAGAARFAVEFIRINPRVLYGLSEAQLIAVAMMAVGGVAFVMSGERRGAVATKAAARA